MLLWLKVIFCFSWFGALSFGADQSVILPHKQSALFSPLFRSVAQQGGQGEQKQLQRLMLDLQRLDQGDSQLYATELTLWYDQVEKWRLKATQECLSKSGQEECLMALDQQWEMVGKRYLESRRALLDRLHGQYQRALAQ